MLISIAATYRGRGANQILAPGEHEVSDSVGEYLLENFSADPFFVERMDEEELDDEDVLETKPDLALETKPVQPQETKPAAATRTRKPKTRRPALGPR